VRSARRCTTTVARAPVPGRPIRACSRTPDWQTEDPVALQAVDIFVRRYRPLPTSLRTGNEHGVRDRRCPKRSGSGRSLHREQSLVESVERRCFSTPGPAYLRRLPRSRGDSRSTGSRPDHFPWSGMFERSVVVLAETFTCRSRGSARGLQGAREERCEQGSSRCFRTSMNTCGGCPAGQRR